MRDSLSNFWWESVTGPATVVGNVTSLLAEAKCVALRMPPHVPWETYLRDAIVEGIRREQATRTLVIEVVENGSMANPEDVLLSFALKGESLSWRPHRESLAAFLQRTRALRGLLIWIRGLDVEGARLWAEVCAGMERRSANDGLFLLECPDVHLPGVAEVSYSSLVGEYASRLMCATIADRALPRSSTDDRREYTAAVLSRLCGGDVELAVSLSAEYLPGRDDPLDILARVSGVPETLVDRGYIHLWEAQLECLFPLIESERLEIVDRHAEQLDELCEEGLVDAFDEPMESRYDIEVGTLYWLSNGGCPYRMRLRDCADDERARIRVLRDCRNLLAHHHVVPEEIVHQVVD